MKNTTTATITATNMGKLNQSFGQMELENRIKCQNEMGKLMCGTKPSPNVGRIQMNNAKKRMFQFLVRKQKQNSTMLLFFFRSFFYEMAKRK